MGIAAAALLLAAVSLPLGQPLPAQSLPSQSLAEEALALAEAKRQAALAQRRSADFERQAAQAVGEAARARAEEAAITARIVAAEADIDAAGARIGIVAALRAQQRARLALRQGPIVRLAAGLQTMARRPPALALVQRGSLADLMHVRALLAGQLPLVRARTGLLRQEVAEGLRLQGQADRAAAILREGQRRLDFQRATLAALETGHRARAQTLVDRAMAEQDRATALGEQARDIVDLMGREREREVLAGRLAALPGPLPRPPIPGFPAEAAPRSGLLSPAGFDYRLPVTGRLVTGLGEVAESGVRARGLTLNPRVGTMVVAPAPGKIVYAGPFRDYGRIVIIDHGGGWTSLVTGIGKMRVRVGERVAPGRALGRAGSTLTVELRRNGQPVDIPALVAQG
ncbi:murein hydrolase activator EnvC family protein [Sphingomonas solaris]|uniref:murein hydrolase activator EnvC family protein n=1 Tax=Alterirhizorhabdus solaris TaxID=2529389 RepID=UPI001EF0C710|nr:peptidoglycan DD-metalloendopeptidase family protein [Sphingomonas solaris]